MTFVTKLHVVLFFAAVVLVTEVQAAQDVHECKPVESAIFLGNRYHIRCDTYTLVKVGTSHDAPEHKVFFFSIDASDPQKVQQAMAITHMAISGDRSIRIWFETVYSNNPPGCLYDDCRSFFALILLK
jgi:hypothetical protein